MNVHAVIGLTALNCLFLIAGACALWGIRGFASWSEALRLAGVSYLVGVALVGLVAVELLIAGVPPGLPTTLTVVACICAAGLLLGRRLRRPHPAGFARGDDRLGAGAVVTTVATVLGIVLAGALFKLAISRGVGAFEWDAWAFWIPKAESFYYWGRLDPQLFASTAAPSYPILVPTLDAMGFHFMGSPDSVTLHLQYWFLLVGFLLSVAGLLRPRVPLWLITPFLALLLAMPEVQLRAITPEADWTLQYLATLAALAVALWFGERRPYLLVLYGLFLAAAMCTKREGQLLAAIVVASALLVTARSARRDWPRLLVVAAAAYVVTLPWQYWWTSHGLPNQTGAIVSRSLLDSLGRTWPSLRLVLRLLFDTSRWLILVPIALVAAVAAIYDRRSRVSAFFLATFVLTVAGYVWILWSIPDLQVTSTSSAATPMPRAVAFLVLLATAFAPLSLCRLLEPLPDATWSIGRLSSLLRMRVVVAVAAGVYIAAAIVPYSLAAKTPTACLPSEHAPPTGLQLSFGTRPTLTAADSLIAAAQSRGFQGLDVVQRSCSAFEVVLPGLPSRQVGSQVQAEARSAGFATAIVSR